DWLGGVRAAVRRPPPHRGLDLSRLGLRLGHRRPCLLDAVPTIESVPMAFRIIETCIGCTACTKRCPTDAISGDRKVLHIISPELCIDCGACAVVRPTAAILDPYGNGQPLSKKSA